MLPSRRMHLCSPSPLTAQCSSATVQPTRLSLTPLSRLQRLGLRRLELCPTAAAATTCSRAPTTSRSSITSSSPPRTLPHRPRMRRTSRPRRSNPSRLPARRPSPTPTRSSTLKWRWPTSTTCSARSSSLPSLPRRRRRGGCWSAGGAAATRRVLPQLRPLPGHVPRSIGWSVCSQVLNPPPFAVFLFSFRSSAVL